MKKYTCKLIPKNKDCEIREFDIEINGSEKKPEVWKLVTAGVIAAFCFGMIIALLSWCSIVNSTKAYIDQFSIILYTVAALISLVTVCGVIVVINLFKAPKCDALESKVVERVIDTVAETEAASEEEGKKKKGFQIKIMKF